MYIKLQKRFKKSSHRLISSKDIHVFSPQSLCIPSTFLFSTTLLVSALGDFGIWSQSLNHTKGAIPNKVAIPNDEFFLDAGQTCIKCSR